MANPYVNKVIVNSNTLIDLTADTVSASDLRSGKTAHNANGAQITGTAAAYVTDTTLYVPDWMVTPND